MTSLHQPLPTSRRDSSQSSLSLHDTDKRSRSDNVDNYPLHAPPKPSEPEHRSLLVPASAGRRHIRKYIRSLVRSDEERPPWAPGVWAGLPVAGLAALVGVLLRMSPLLVPFFLIRVSLPGIPGNSAADGKCLHLQSLGRPLVCSFIATTCPTANGASRSSSALSSPKCGWLFSPLWPTPCSAMPLLKGWRFIFGALPVAEPR